MSSVKRSYGPGSEERNALEAALVQMEQELPFEVPCIVNGKPVSSCRCVFQVLASHVHVHVYVRIYQDKTGTVAKQPIPQDHARHLCTYHEADPATVSSAIEGALTAKASWETMPWPDRAAIFLKAADLGSGKYRYKLMAATMLGQGKNAWQAEIDAAAEVRYRSPFSKSQKLIRCRKAS